MPTLARPADEIDWELSLLVLDGLPVGVVICDQNDKIIQHNTELSSLFGYEHQELIGKPIEILLPEESQQQHRAQFMAYMSNPEKKNMGMGREYLGRRKDGSIFPVEVGLNPVETPSGHIVIATVADISHRRSTEKNFQKIVDEAPIGMLLVDVDGTITHSNRQLVNIFGYTQTELLGNPLEILLPTRHREQHQQYRNGYQDKPTTRAMGIGRDLTGLHKSTTEIPVEIGLNPIETENGTIIVATINDISERKQSETSLQQAKADLDEFTYVASHDLKSPLRGISSLIEWIAEDLGDEMPGDVQKNLDRVHVRINRMEKLIEDLLVYARAGRKQGSSGKIILKDAINNVIQFIAPPDGFNIVTTGYLDEIQSSITPLETVLRNIISNAIKHHDREQGTIHINVSIDGSYCIFNIEDDGPGIPPNAHQRIFKLFQTLSSEDGTRSGVGLAISKQLIEAYGGKIEIHSPENSRGTCFRFWWPRFARSDINE